jgi:hypothetical protein
MEQVFPSSAVFHVNGIVSFYWALMGPSVAAVPQTCSFPIATNYVNSV